MTRHLTRILQAAACGMLGAMHIGVHRSVCAGKPGHRGGAANRLFAAAI
jgi:hypothetical protein